MVWGTLRSEPPIWPTVFPFRFYFAFLSGLATVDMADYINKKLVIVGDGTVGKTCILMRYTQGRFFGDSRFPRCFLRSLARSASIRPRFFSWSNTHSKRSSTCLNASSIIIKLSFLTIS